MRYLIDTNILLRFFDRQDPRNSDILAALDILTTNNAEVYICGQVLIEYWAAATRPREVNGLGLSPQQADVNLADIETLFECLPEPFDVIDRWRQLAREYSVSGKQAHDTRIAAFMLAYNITHILTLNSNDFSRYEGIIPITPHELINNI
jgi:predicted nucleic acid-binding protein